MIRTDSLAHTIRTRLAEGESHEGLAAELGLTPDEIDRLFIEARNELVVANQRLVYKYVARITSRSRLASDLIAEGMLGLIEAARIWQPSRGAFSTCAWWQIRCRVSHAYRKDRQAHVPTRPDWVMVQLADRQADLERAASTEVDLRDRCVQVERAMRRLTPRLRRVIRERAAGKTLRQVGEVLGISPERVRQLHAKAAARVRQVMQEVAG